MDCPSEERMIRIALEGMPQIKNLSFDFGEREVVIVHDIEIEPILQKLVPLGLDILLLETQLIDEDFEIPLTRSQSSEASALLWLLLINGLMFGIELTVGLLSQSAGLIADSLDNLADASVYGISFYVVKRSQLDQLKAAHLSGKLQMLLAFGVLFEVGRRFLFGSEPESLLMIGFGIVALIANIFCLLIIHRHRDGGVHMKASWIFSANDVIANAGVILAGILVSVTGSHYPDLVIGTIIGLVVLSGALRIMRL